MTTCLLVDLAPEEHDRLAGLAGATCVTAADLAAPDVRSPAAEIDVVIVGSRCPDPVAAVQHAHRTLLGSGVVVLTTGDSHDAVRRSLSYAPGVPLGLVLVPPDEPLLPRVESLRAATAEQRRHATLVRAVSERAQTVRSPSAPVVTALGALLEHAPLGVLVCGTNGRLLGWNAHADQVLRLPPGTAGQAVEGLLPGSGAVLRERTAGTPAPDDRTDPPRPSRLRNAAGVEVEVTAVPSRLADGRDVVLLLLVDVTSRREAERVRDQLAGQVELLGQVSESLMGTLDTHEALRRLARLLVPVLGDWVSIQVADDEGRLSVVTMHHRDPAMSPVVAQARRRQTHAAGERAPSRRAGAGDPILLTGLHEADLSEYVPDDELRALFVRLGVGSAIAVPLPGRDRILGSLVLVNGPESRELTDADLAVGIEVGRRAGIALDNARLYSQQHQLATELQRSLLTEPPEPDHVEVVVRYVAAARQAQVGGDWYDAFVQPDGGTVLVIGDVVGHDTRAAAAMGQLRGLVRGIGYTTGAEPAEVLTRVDDAIRGLMSETTATAVVARLEQTDAQARQGCTTLRWSNAGHPPPILLGADGRVRVLDGASPGTPPPEADLLLGIDPGTPRRTWEVALPRGCTVLMFTDGLVERRGQSLDEGLAHLVEVLAGCHGRSVEELCDTALAAMLPGEPDDDVAIVAVRLHPQDGPRPPEAAPRRVPGAPT